jgi:anti-sigma factor RsiW
MKCEDSRVYLPAYLDDELDVTESLRMQRHLVGCPVCREAQKEYLALRDALHSADLFSEPSGEFEKRIEAAVRRAARDEVRASRSFSPGALWPGSWWTGTFRWVPAAAAVLVMTTIGVLFVLHNVRASHEKLIASAVLTGHIRSLQADHLVDVPSSDRHTVKPWFQGKLDFSPPVPDLSDRGWILIGGRLDYVDGKPVAALVYQRRKHNINVFLWPNHSAADEAFRQEDAQGYQILHWNGADMTYWLVSDLNYEELHELARALRGH